jgi:N6-adenosine-specific RNA methylase IME4
MSELAKIESYCELNKTNLTFRRDVSKDEWMSVFHALKQVEGCVQFWIGDCLAYRQRKWGMYEDIAEETGYDTETLRQYKRIAESVESGTRVPDLGYAHHREVASLPPDKQEFFLNKAVDENLSVRELKAEIRKTRKEFVIKEMPIGVYDLIYCDPPWQYDFSETDTRKIENQYPTMSVDEICNMTLPKIADDALLLMWGTAPKLLEAIKVIDSWGFTYKTHGIWDKETIGMGYWFRGQHELLLVATKGTFSPPEPQNRKPSVYREAKTSHSTKPSFFYEWIGESFPYGKKIELFARTKYNDTWEVWGNE